MALEQTVGLQEVTEVGATSDQDLTLSGDNSFTGDNTYDHATVAIPALSANVQTSGGAGKCLSLSIDGVEEGTFEKVLGVFNGYVNTSGTNIFFSAGFGNFILIDNVGGGVSYTAANQHLFNNVIRAQISGSAGAPIYSWGTSTNSGMYLIAAGNPGLSAAGSLALDWTSTRVKNSLAEEQNRSAYASTATIAATDRIAGFTGTGGGTLTIPSAKAVDGRVFTIQDEGGNAGTNNITIATAGSENINGAATIAITTNYGALDFYSDGTDFFAR